MNGEHARSGERDDRWPDGTRGAVSLTFDNLGEAADEELGLPVAVRPHRSVTHGLPAVLDDLARHGLRATFFVEGVNAHTNPEAVRSIVAAGHECGYHAWHHEEWSALDDDEERRNLERGLQALRALGVSVSGFRPPGGRLRAGTLERLSHEGIRHCSPAGTGVGGDDVVLLPFAWRHVDAFHLLPAFSGLRSRLGSSAPTGPAGVSRSMIAAVDDAIARGGHATLVLHPALLEQEHAEVRAVLAHVADAARRGALWAAPCDAVAQWVGRHPDRFPDAVQLDTTASWSQDEAPAAPNAERIR